MTDNTTRASQPYPREAASFRAASQGMSIFFLTVLALLFLGSGKAPRLLWRAPFLQLLLGGAAASYMIALWKYRCLPVQTGAHSIAVGAFVGSIFTFIFTSFDIVVMLSHATGPFAVLIDGFSGALAITTAAVSLVLTSVSWITIGDTTTRRLSIWSVILFAVFGLSSLLSFHWSAATQALSPRALGFLGVGGFLGGCVLSLVTSYRVGRALRRMSHAVEYQDDGRPPVS